MITSKSLRGNIKLADLSLEQLNNRHVCNLHFKPTDFNNIETQQRLKQNVIPIKYDFTELPTNVGQYIPTPSFNECEHPESPNLHCFQFKNLPKDSRTLLHTPSTSTVLKTIEGGLYYHFGVVNEIEYLFKTHKNVPTVLQLLVGDDDLPLIKNPPSQLWPILGYFSNVLVGKPEVFIIGAYYAKSKPSDCNEYLQDFVDELYTLINVGIVVNNVHFKVLLKAIICDALAKSYILNFRGYTAKNSCLKCSTIGQYENNRVYFPDLISNLMTHRDFVACIDTEFHCGETVVSKIPEFDIINITLFDSMHSVCIGVMKKMLMFWTGDTKLNSLGQYIPHEFQRSPNENSRKHPIHDASRLTATELRQILLYTGMVIFHDFVSKYCGFLGLDKKICWFSYLQKDEKEVYFSMSQVAYIISKHTALNSNDGANYKVKSVAGPFATRSSTHFGSVLLETNDVLQGLNSSSIDGYKENNMNITTRFARPACSGYEQNNSASMSYPKETHQTSEPYDDLLLTPEYTSLNNVFQENSVNKEGTTKYYLSAKLFSNNILKLLILKFVQILNNHLDDINEIAEFICNSGNACNFMIDNDVIKNVENSTNCSLTESVNINGLYSIKLIVVGKILFRIMKSFALPIPTLPTAFINLLSAKSIEEVYLLESLLLDETDGLKDQEELVKALSGFRTDPQTEIRFHNVIDNYIRHSGFLVSKEISS
ncbi:hypothetical protein AGLY_016446 [Aphis glycines]|uniref:THAP-type domain-containing protein n=1 Tax=Aphis glycines TaxID=307491 RepID=A0A6G0SZQ3_APHGL|nr:hypothetical protein AGLY_016446 [Aphis glycines]